MKNAAGVTASQVRDAGWVRIVADINEDKIQGKAQSGQMWSLPSAQTDDTYSAAATGKRPSQRMTTAAEGASRVASDEENAEFVMAAFGLWEMDVGEQITSLEPSAFVTTARRTAAQYRSEKAEVFETFRHGQRAAKATAKVISECLRMYSALKKYEKQPAKFHDAVQQGMIDIRMAIQGSTQRDSSLRSLGADVRVAIDAFLERIATGAKSADAEELQFLLVTMHTWNDALNKLISGIKNPQPKMIVTAAEQALDQIRNDIERDAPSPETSKTLLYLLKQCIKVIGAAADKATTISEFGQFLGDALLSISRSILAGTKGGTLKAVRGEAAQTAKDAIREINGKATPAE